MTTTKKNTTTDSKSTKSVKDSTKSTSNSTSSSKITSKTSSKSTSSKGKSKTDFDNYKENKKGTKRKYEKEYKNVDEINKDIDDERTYYAETAQTRKVKDEIVIIISFLISVLMILSFFNICGVVGNIINWFLFGFMGAFAYVFPFVFFGTTLFLLAYRYKMIARAKLTFCTIVLLCITSLIHLFTVIDEVSFFKSFGIGYDERRGGGLFGAILAEPLNYLFGKTAAVIILIVIIIVCIMMLTGKALLSLVRDKSKEEYKNMAEKHKEHKAERARKLYEENMQKAQYDREKMLNKGNQSYNVVIDKKAGEYVPKKKNDNFLDRLKQTGGNINTSNNQYKSNDLVDDNKATENVKNTVNNDLDMVEITGPSEQEITTIQEEVYLAELRKKFGENSSVNNSQPNEIIKDNSYDNGSIVTAVTEKTVTSSTNTSGNFGMNTDNVSKSANSDIFARGDYKKVVDSNTPADVAVAGNYSNINQQPVSHSLNGQQAPLVDSTNAHKAYSESVAKEIENKPKKPKRPYQFPPLSKLNLKTSGAMGSKSELQETARKLEETLNSFGVKVSVTDYSCGPTVTRYELTPEQGVKVSRITSLADDIKLNLAAADIRIEAPIPGKSAVGIEVPNKTNQVVTLGSIINSEEFKSSNKKTAFAVGKDIGGQAIVTDIAKMPHLLIAGATGSGKSVCINTLIVSLLYKASPEDVKLILIDPKVVELSVYNGIPHLLIPVVSDPKKASAALYWAVNEMEDRFKKFSEFGVRDLEGYNKKVTSSATPLMDSEGKECSKMPQIIIVIDELADLMMVASAEVEDYICRIAQKARAAGIHLVIATQRPSVNVITGLIKANVPSRIAFSVASQIDSRTILDMQGAEKLLGKGDMLFAPSGIPKPVRVQGAYVSDDEVNSIVDFIKSHNDDDYDSSVEEKMSKAPTDSKGSKQADVSSTGSSDSGSDYDEYLYASGVLIITKQKASIGALQRQFKIGFNRAARIMDQLADFNVVGPEEGTKPRQIIMDMNAFMQCAEANGFKND